MQRKLKKIFIMTFIVLATVSCGRNELYRKTIEFDNYKWERLSKDKTHGNSIDFTDINVKDNKDPYDIYITVRHSSLINVGSVKFVMEMTSPNGTTRSSMHTINLKDRSGKKFIGDVAGDLYDVEERVKSFMSFTETGKYTIRIINLAPVYEVIGIIDMTMSIKKSDLDYDLK
ncbi:MAG: gliding motility lipoprotein GldH [Bacteroidales bacterium]|nr:gliding motility lipoprotein GldH [Bacteroidales bacterium]